MNKANLSKKGSEKLQYLSYFIISLTLNPFNKHEG